MRTKSTWLALAVVVAMPACGAPTPPAEVRGESGFCQRMRDKWAAQGLSQADVEAKAVECDRLAAKQADKRRADEAAHKRAAEDAARQEAKDQAESEAAERAESAKKAAADGRAIRLREWQAAWAEKCAAAYAAIGCDDAAIGTSDEAIAECRSSCASAVDKAATTALAEAESACVERYASAAGNGVFSCSLSLPPGAELQGDALKARLAECSKGCMTRGADAVALARKLRLEKEQAEADRRRAEQAEREAAEARAKERARAAATAPGLVTSFHKCMVDVDAAPDAKDLRARDCALYKGFMQKAQDRCRAKYSCDWIEDYSELACQYSMLPCY